MNIVDLQLDLPPGWVEHPNPAGPAEFRARADGSTGLLQVSKLPAGQFDFIAQQPSLGAFAEEIGRRLSHAQDWGQAAGHKEGRCELGRFGFAMFLGGAFPAMFLWVTVSSNAAHMWTWLGPDPTANEAMQAVQVVLDARPRTQEDGHLAPSTEP